MRRRSPRRKRDAVAVEEFEDLDRDLAAVVEPVAELRRGELAVRRRAPRVDGDLHHLGHGAAQEEMIVRDLVDLAHAAEQLQQPPHVGLPDRRACRRCRAPAAAGSARRRQISGRISRHSVFVRRQSAAPHGRASAPRRRRGQFRAARAGPAAAAEKTGAGRRGSSCSRSRSSPCPARSGLSAWNVSSVAIRLRLSCSQSAADSASTLRCAGDADHAAMRFDDQRPTSSAASARSRAKAVRST